MEDPHSPENLSEAQEQLWQTMLQFSTLAASQERNRIARDLHDSLGHSLTALNIQLQTAAKLWQLDPDRAAEFLAEAHRLGSTAVKEVRQTVKNLREDGSEVQTLDSRIADLVESFHRTTNILPITQINLNASVLGETVTEQLYRIIQEALNNICKYAQATVVNIFLETDSASLCLVIQDNGRGFNYDQVQHGYGLVGIQERVGLLRGQLQINTAPGEGCRIQVDIPIQLVTLRKLPLNQPPTISAAESSLDLVTSVEVSNLSSTELLITGPICENEIDESIDNVNENLINSNETETEIEFESHEMKQAEPVVLSAEQTDRIERILLDLIGPIAPVLLQNMLTQAQEYQTLIEQLSLTLNDGQRRLFLQQLNYKVSSSLALPLTPSEPTSLPHGTAVDEQEIQRCVQELTQVIGPIAQFLVQDVLEKSSQMDLVELVSNLVEKIPDRQKAQQFQHRMRT